MRNLGLYIHIPFCVKKCDYCDFYSLGCVANGGIERYIDALCKHLEIEGENYADREIDTVFFGGGTPSILSADLIKRVFNTLKKSFKLSHRCEISLEANPGTVTEEKARVYKEVGVNRVSIGLQSVNDAELKLLGRIHTFDEFKESYAILKKAGIENINIDLMYALPGQKTEDFIKNLDTVVEFEPEHISAYCLKIEKNTRFYEIKDTLDLPDEDEQYGMYMALCAFLDGKDYEQYEISNFAKKGGRCVHNLKYWLSHDYLGFGPSAHSCIDGIRYSLKESIDEYVKALETGKYPEKLYEAESALTKEEKMDEYVMLRFRLSDGVCINEFNERFDADFRARYKKLEMYEKNGYICQKSGAYTFTPKGFFVSNYILSDILENI